MDKNQEDIAVLWQKYADLEDVDAAMVGGKIPVICFSCCQMYDVMDDDRRVLSSSNISALSARGAKYIDGLADDVSDLTPEMLEGSTPVFLFSRKSDGGYMAAARLDQPCDMVNHYTHLAEYQVLDETNYAEHVDEYKEDSKGEIITHLVRKVFAANPDIEERFDEEVTADSEKAMEESWSDIKECVGLESSGWFIDDEERALDLAKEALLWHLDEIETMHSDMAMRP